MHCYRDCMATHRAMRVEQHSRKKKNPPQDAVDNGVGSDSNERSTHEESCQVVDETKQRCV